MSKSKLTPKQKLEYMSFIVSTKRHKKRRVVPLNYVFKILKEEKKKDEEFEDALIRLGNKIDEMKRFF